MREHRVQSLLDGVPVVMVQCGVVAAWAGLLTGRWELATALLVANAVSGFDWFGRVAGAVVTEAPGTRAWMHATSALAGGGDLMELPGGMDLSVRHRRRSRPAPSATRCARSPCATSARCTTTAPSASRTSTSTSAPASWSSCSARSGSGKSSLLGALAGLVSSTGEIRWNDRGRRPTRSPTCARPGWPTSPRCRACCRARFTGNVGLDHPTRPVMPSLEAARMGRDVTEAGGPDSLVGHRGVRLSGGQVQRLALARALATEADVLLADDVSSALDAATEIELWQALRERGATVIGATSKAAALAQADRVVVLDAGRVVDQGPWRELSSRWGAPGRLTRSTVRAVLLGPHGWVVACASSSPEHRVSSAPT